MDEWKKVVQWAAREEEEKKRKDREQVRRTIRAWPVIAVATIPFGWLAFVTLDPTSAIVCTITDVVVVLLIVEHFVQRQL